MTKHAAENYLPQPSRAHMVRLFGYQRRLATDAWRDSTARWESMV